MFDQWFVLTLSLFALAWLAAECKPLAMWVLRQLIRPLKRHRWRRILHVPHRRSWQPPTPAHDPRDELGVFRRIHTR